MSNPVILTTGFQYTPVQADIFFRSLSPHFKGELVLFTDQPWKMPEGEHSFQITNLHPEKNSELFTCPHHFNSANNLRYFFYRKYLEKNPDAEMVLLTDLRDVLFQSDPFHFARDGNLHVAAEPVALRSCGSNSGWFSKVYGKDELDRMGEFPVICSGTTLGSREVIMSYLGHMCRALEVHGKRLDMGRNTTIIDQAIHIHYCHSQQTRLTTHTLDSGRIATLHHAKTLRLDQEGRLLNAEEVPYAIVHQYDRNRQLRLIFSDQYEHKNLWDVDRAIRQYLASSDDAKIRKLLTRLTNTAFCLIKERPPK